MFWLPLFPPPPELEPVDAGGGGGVKLGVNAGSVRDVKVDDDMVAVGQAQEAVTKDRETRYDQRTRGWEGDPGWRYVQR